MISLFLLTAIIVGKIQAKVPGTPLWIPGPNGKFYINLNQEKKNKDASRKLCEGAGGFLPQPMNLEENVFLRKFADTFYLGLNDIRNEGVWMWERGPANVQWSDWIIWSLSNREPNGKTIQNCAVLLKSKGWADVACTSEETTTVVCEQNRMPLWIPGPNGKFYIILNQEKKNKDASRKLCEGAGGFLPQPMNLEENEFLKEIAYTFYLGLNDIRNEGVWMWERGPAKVQWFDWTIGSVFGTEPEIKDCVVISKSKGWAYVACTSDETTTVVCEQNPPCDPDGHKVINDARVQPGPWNKCFSKTFRVRWYRFQIHGRDYPMPTECQRLNRCAPYAPLWMRLKGELPINGKEMAAEACASSENECCAWSTPMAVRNCGNFLLYNLEDVPTCFLRYCTEVNIVSPNPIVKDWPMEVKCSVATIGGLQKLKGIDDSYLIYKMWLSRQKSGKWLRVAELNTLTGELDINRPNLPHGVRDVKYNAPERNENESYQNVLSAHITMQVGTANYLDHVTNYSCEIEYGYGTGPRFTMVFKQTPSYTDRQPKTTPEPTTRAIVTPAHPLPFYEDLRYQIVMFVLLVLFLVGGFYICCRMMLTPGPSSEKLSFETRSSVDSRDFSDLSSVHSKRFYEAKGRIEHSSKKPGRTSKQPTQSSKGKSGRGKKQSSKRSGRSSSRRSGSSKYTEDDNYYY